MVGTIVDVTQHNGRLITADQWHEIRMDNFRRVFKEAYRCGQEDISEANLDLAYLNMVDDVTIDSVINFNIAVSTALSELMDEAIRNKKVEITNQDLD